jgi:COP9 signalosome complex subunit 6
MGEDKDVHKVPALDLAGWFTLCPESGPTAAFLAIHKQFLAHNESALLLAFHPSAISSSAIANINGKLPLTIYETVYENEPTKQDDSMQIDGEETSGIRFRSIPYTIETDETEMIAVDYVAKGGGNAAAATSLDTDVSTHQGREEREDKKGKRRADEPPEASKAVNNTTSADVLNSEEEDLVASLTTRLNSVRMLQSRLTLLSTYISSLPPSSLSDPESETNIEPEHLSHLRNIRALLTRLSLLTPHAADTSAATVPTTTVSFTAIHNPPQPDALSHAQQAQTNDVNLSSLLALLGQDVQGLSELGRKFALVENARQTKGKKIGGGGGGGMGMGFGGYGRGGGGGGGGGDDSLMT